MNKARRNVAAALQNHPDLKMLVGIWSYNAPAIVDEVKAAGKRSSLKLVTFDAEPNTLLALKEGLLDATAVQNPYMMGYLGVKVLKALLNKDEATVKAVVGESGSGKSVTANTMLRLLPKRGHIVSGSMLFRDPVAPDPVDIIKLDGEGDEIRRLRGSATDDR